MSETGMGEGVGINRSALSNEDKAARELFKKWAEEDGLNLYIDRIGNMFAILKANAEKWDSYDIIDIPSVGIGSHLDSVPNGGIFDGPLGVIAALEIAHTLHNSDKKRNRNLVVANFTNEEGTRFTPDMMGSLATAKPERTDELLSATDHNDISVLQALKKIGYNGLYEPGFLKIDYFLEFHIEQGPLLEQENKQIGIVEKVQGIYWCKLILNGDSAHAGTTPQSYRNDPMAAFNEVHSFLRTLMEEDDQLLITVGSINSEPGSINVIPSRVTCTLDVRHPDSNKFESVKSSIHHFTENHKGLSNTDLKLETLVDISPVVFAGELVGLLEKKARSLGFSYQKMCSGAGHDAQMMASATKSAMIFIPSENGISHNPREYSKPEDIETGTRLMFEAVKDLIFSA